jgi:maltokinase
MTLEDTLASWLPTQRWFSGRKAPIGTLAITTDVTLAAGDPEFRHLVITASQGGDIARYQILAGLRSQLPASLDHAVIGPAAGGMTAYDALYDPALASILLRSIAGQHSIGPLRFIREPGAPISDWADSRVLTAEQSNTSLVFGESAILKVLRRPFPGENPDLEVAGALSRLGSSHVAAPLGWIETRLDGENALLGVLSKFLPDSIDGWSLALSGLRRLYDGLIRGTETPGTEASGTEASGTEARGSQARADGARANGTRPPAEADPHFTGEAYLLGQAAAEMHVDLAAAFGTGLLAPEALAHLAAHMMRQLDKALGEVPELGRHEAKLRAAFAGLGDIKGPVAIQRVHGDFHLGQVLRTQNGWVALDFEGEPAIPLAQRRARYPALKDVAGMLRSFDYAARHPLLGHPDAQRLRAAAQAWAQQAKAAFCAGYASAGGTDPMANSALLRALMLEKAVYEVIYESRQRPDWLSIPLDSIAAA